MKILVVLIWVLTFFVFWGFSSGTTYQALANRSSYIEQLLVDAGMQENR